MCEPLAGLSDSFTALCFKDQADAIHASLKCTLRLRGPQAYLEGIFLLVFLQGCLTRPRISLRLSHKLSTIFATAGRK